jgi:hypothetical protein
MLESRTAGLSGDIIAGHVGRTTDIGSSLMRGLLLASAGLLACAGLALAVESGPEIGASTSAFHSKDITGPNKGKSLCYR